MYEYVEYTEKLKSLLEDIFNEEFMQDNTRFSGFESFKYSSAVFINWDADQLIYNKEVFDNFVKESTNFSSWEEMVQAGTSKYFNIKKQGGI
ncbi:hypothetical protein I6U48_28715 [Clostridium sp. PL3]|uniref:Uncharacterized protein n=1 Tax=Clostridium thailandense TaxID=2794346 RepID=A0A949U3S0_9CLOT|nr:hypothetical protein [Clostridium thailandense]MBV7276856.1 hypothetical protein [Clostridium thailandense]